MHTRRAIERAIDEEVHNIKENGDISDGEMDSQERRQVAAIEPVLTGCSGFLDAEGVGCCEVGNNIELHDTEEDDRFIGILSYKLASGEIHYFCKASHFIRYLIKYHMGKKTKKNNTQNNEDNENNNNNTLAAREGRGERAGVRGAVQLLLLD